MLPTLRKNVRSVWDDPFEMLQREFDRALGRSNGGSTEGRWVASYPVDIHEDENHIYVEAEMPGFKKDEVDVTLESGVLTIAAERKTEKKEDATQHLTERTFTRVYRSFSLPNTVDEGKVNAELKEGVLYLKLDKREEVKPRKIEIK
ncbi:MAG: Hsp20 family protein [Phycisphaera sp.]|nr:Hsp20 family protein [Phycisphaera sp.]